MNVVLYYISKIRNTVPPQTKLFPTPSAIFTHRLTALMPMTRGPRDTRAEPFAKIICQQEITKNKHIYLIKYIHLVRNIIIDTQCIAYLNQFRLFILEEVE